MSFKWFSCIPYLFNLELHILEFYDILKIGLYDIDMYIFYARETATASARSYFKHVQTLK